MAILLSGDFHANAMNELSRITKKSLIQRYSKELFGEIKYHIILGDGGFLWPGNSAGDKRIYRALAERPFPVLCVFGNHDPVLGRQDLPEIDAGIGEKVILVRREKPFVAYLKRGKKYLLENRKFLALGGALSIDKEYRRPNISWWEQEYWTEAEKSELLERLEKENKFDYVLSHTGPGRINEAVFYYLWKTHGLKFTDHVAAFNDIVDSKIQFRDWFCGHWHKDESYRDDKLKRSYRFLYEKTALITEDEIIIR